MSGLRLGTRGSALALAQARWVAERLPGEVAIVKITTAGDVQRAEPASPVPDPLRGRAPAGDPGDKSRWTGALERALLAGEIDLAVHSAKDVPGELAAGTHIAAVPPREDPRDVLVGAPSLDALPSGARVGTSALRRRAQLLAVRPDLDVVELRGNVDTRLRKLADGEVDALVLAAAGLARLGRDDVVAARLEHDVFVPAPGQGALLVQARADTRADAVDDPAPATARAVKAVDDPAAHAALATARAVKAVDDPAAHAALATERGVAAKLGASCHTAIGVHAADGAIRAFVGLPDGSEWLLDEVADAAGADDELAARLLSMGAADLLARAEAMSA